MLKFIENPEQSGLRIAWRADQDRGNATLGYYCDNYQDETFIPAVWRLTTRKGKPRFVAGYIEPWNDAAIIDPADIHEGEAGDDEAPRDARSSAHHIAEKAAEKQRAYDEASSDGATFSELGDQIISYRCKVRALLRERRAVASDIGRAPTICAQLREDVQRILSEYRQAQKERAELVDKYAGAWCADLRDTFNETAGI